MKKLLSLCVTVTLILSSFAFAVPGVHAEEAEGTETTAIRYEFEEKLTGMAKTHLKTYSDATLVSGGKALYNPYAANPSDKNNHNEIFEESFTVTVPKTQNYDIFYAVSKGNNQYVSNVSILINGELIGDNKGTAVKDLSHEKTVFVKDAPLMLYHGKSLPLEADKEYTVTLRVHEPTVNASGGTQPFFFGADYIEFVPVDYVEITDDFTLEFEKYTKYFSCKVSEETAGDIGYVHADTAANSGDSYFNLAVDVPKAGEYDFDLKGVYTEWLSRYEVLIDGEVAYSVAYKDKNGAVVYDADGTAIALNLGDLKSWKFKKILTAGEHIIGVKIYARVSGQSGVTDGDCAFDLESLSVKWADTNISVNDEAVVEFEDYTENFSCAVTTSPEMSNGDVAVYQTETKGDHTFTAVLNVAQEGVYGFELKGAHADYLSAYDIMLDDTVIYNIMKGSPAGTVIKDADGNNIVYDGQFYTARKWSFSAEMTEGTHILCVKIYARTSETSGSNNGTVAFALDSLSMKYRKANIAKSGKTVVEFEDYAQNATTKTSSDGSQTILANSGTTVQPRIKIPMTVEKSGLYKVSSVLGYAKDNYRSKINLKLDGTTFETNDSGYVSQVTEGLQGTSVAPMSLYQTTLWLEAGTEHFVTAEISITEDKQYKYNLDYIAFEPVNSFAVAEGVATATVGFEEAVSGKAILALYNGKELVSVGDMDADAQNIVTVTAAATKEFDSAKVFVWNDYDAVEPVVKSVSLLSAE